MFRFLVHRCFKGTEDFGEVRKACTDVPESDGIVNGSVAVDKDVAEAAQLSDGGNYFGRKEAGLLELAEEVVLFPRKGKVVFFHQQGADIKNVLDGELDVLVDTILTKPRERKAGSVDGWAAFTLAIACSASCNFSSRRSL